MKPAERAPRPARLSAPRGVVRGMLVTLAVLVMALLPSVLPTFSLTLLNLVAIAAMVVLGLYLLTGLARMTSFGQAAFMGVAAYATAILTTRYGLSPWLGLLAGLALSGGAAFLLGALTVRLKGHYLPLATIAWQMAIYIVFGNLVALTGGHTGISGVPPVTLFGLELRSSSAFYYLAWGGVALALLGAGNLTRSRTGRALRALRGDAVAAASFGVNPPLLRLQVFVVAGLLAGVAGWLYAHFLRFVNPTPFSLDASITYLIMGVVGGLAALPGVLLGAGLITWLENWLQGVLPLVLGRSGNYEVVALGLILVTILLFAPKGLWGFVERLVPAPRRAPPGGEGLPATRFSPRGERLGQRTESAANEPLLVVEALSKHFGGLVAVNDLSFTVRRGEILGLIGPNGAGKSTSFNLITGALAPTSGAVRYRGERLSGLPPYRVARKGLARTFQHPHLFNDMTVLDNVALGTYARTSAGLLASALRLDLAEERRARAEAYQQLARVGLTDVAFARPGDLPLGKQRLLEIARALAADPEMLLLDEPAAGLRKAEKAELAALVRRLKAEGVTVLFVDHDMELVMNLVDRVVVMNYGELLASGTPAEVRANPKVVEAYLGSALGKRDVVHA
jgi:branched-chain amino acid transport system permease protein